MEEEEAELEKRLLRISEEIKKQEQCRKREEERSILLEKKRKKLQHWEMLRWIVTYIDKNTLRWAAQEQKKLKNVKRRKRKNRRCEE